MSQLRRVFSGLAQSCTKPTMVPTPPETSIRLLMVFTRSSGVPMVEAAPSPPAVFSTASSGEANGCRPGRCSVPTLYSLCQRISPAPASRRACSRLSAMCQLSNTRQLARLTVVPCFLAASSAKPHWVGSAIKPCVDIEPSEMMPMPYLPASVMPDGEICDATTNGISSCSGRICSAASFMVNQSLLAVALRHRIDAERVRVGGERPRTGTEDGAASGHVVELHHALRDVEGMVIGQRDHAGAELDALGTLAGGGQEHLRRGDGFPARGMMFTAPEFVISERIELFDEIEV